MGDFFDFIDPVEDKGVVIIIIGFDEGTAPTPVDGGDFLIWQRRLLESTDIDVYSWKTSDTGEEDAAFALNAELPGLDAAALQDAACRGALVLAIDGSSEVTGGAFAAPDGEMTSFTVNTGAERMEFWSDFF